MYQTFNITRRRKALPSDIDRDLFATTSMAMVTVILSDICNTLSKIFPGSKYHIVDGIRITTISKPIIGFFLAIAKRRSDDFAIFVGDGEINLKLNKTVSIENMLLTWIKLLDIVTMHYQILDTPALLDDTNFIDKELIG